MRLILTALALAAAPAAAAPLVTPAEHRRPADQTFLTVPEWFLVFSPEEYAAALKPATRSPANFPFFAHVGQFWQSYREVARQCQPLPANAGYHVMIGVIGVSTTFEYALKGVYEGLIGRFTEALGGADTSEDRLSARVAQDYVDFIKVRPWYEFDFVTPLRQLWAGTPGGDRSLLRKWERTYLLTSEYAVKAGYAKLIEVGTRSSYDVPIERTVAIVRAPPGAALPPSGDIKLMASDGQQQLLDMPRRQVFADAATALAERGYKFTEVAGNRGAILATFVGKQAPPPGGREIYRQPILTGEGGWRFAIAYPVARLGETLRTAAHGGDRLEHLYDY